MIEGYRADIAFFEAPEFEMQSWRGRIQLLNGLAYFFFKQKDIANALKLAFEAQSIAIE